MKTRRIEAVLIDFFGTIADGDRHQVELTCSHIVRDYGLKLTAGELAYRWGHSFFKVIEHCNGHQFKTLYECERISLLEIMSELGVVINPQPYLDELREYWRNPPLHGEAKEALRQLPVPICCVSNIDHDDVIHAIASHGLKFDNVITSELANSYKPDELIFNLAVEKMGVKAENCMHVGDSIHSDIHGAQRVGALAVWIHRDKRILDIGTAKPDYTIRSLMELRQFFI